MLCKHAYNRPDGQIAACAATDVNHLSGHCYGKSVPSCCAHCAVPRFRDLVGNRPVHTRAQTSSTRRKTCPTVCDLKSVDLRMRLEGPAAPSRRSKFHRNGIHQWNLWPAGGTKRDSTNQRIGRRAFLQPIRACWSVNRRGRPGPASNDPNACRSCWRTCCSRCMTPPPSARCHTCKSHVVSSIFPSF